MALLVSRRKIGLGQRLPDLLDGSILHHIANEVPIGQWHRELVTNDIFEITRRNPPRRAIIQLAGPGNVVAVALTLPSPTDLAAMPSVPTKSSGWRECPWVACWRGPNWPLHLPGSAPPTSTALS
jgi:hypothetical protein